MGVLLFIAGLVLLFLCPWFIGAMMAAGRGPNED